MKGRACTCVGIIIVGMAMQVKLEQRSSGHDSPFILFLPLPPSLPPFLPPSLSPSLPLSPLPPLSLPPPFPQGLKKVTNDMKTHKNPGLRAGGVVKSDAIKKPQTTAAPKFGAAAAKKNPICELQNKKWVVVSGRGQYFLCHWSGTVKCGRARALRRCAGQLPHLVMYMYVYNTYMCVSGPCSDRPESHA